MNDCSHGYPSPDCPTCHRGAAIAAAARNLTTATAFASDARDVATAARNLYHGITGEQLDYTGDGTPDDAELARRQLAVLAARLVLDMTDRYARTGDMGQLDAFGAAVIADGRIPADALPPLADVASHLAPALVDILTGEGGRSR